MSRAIRDSQAGAFAIALGTLGPSSLCRGQSNFPAIDDARAAAAGIRKLPGKRLTLYTDLSGAEIDVAGRVRAGVSAMVQVFPRRMRANSRLAHDGLSDEG